MNYINCNLLLNGQQVPLTGIAWIKAWDDFHEWTLSGGMVSNGRLQMDIPDEVMGSNDKMGINYQVLYPGCSIYQGRALAVKGSIELTNPETNQMYSIILTVGQNPFRKFPPVPTREEVLGVNMHFRGGLLVESSQYGLMPWWPSALTWLSYQDRQEVYKVSHAAGDTHQIIEVPNGKPLYNEEGQFYSPDKFGPLDWTNNETQIDSRLSDIVDEVIQAGFKYIIAMDEVMEDSTKIVKLVMEALSATQLQYGFTIPGYDSVFYGWEPVSLIQNWATLARSIQPNCYLGIEHNVGHIPLGEDNDYELGGRMDGFDVILGEFGANDSNHNDPTWQVLGRMIRPYYRPPDQPANDDPNPPFRLFNSPRGPRYYCAFEDDDPYRWVRINPNDANAVANQRSIINNNTAYFKSMGCKYIG